jgi:hypothetical protein
MTLRLDVARLLLLNVVIERDVVVERDVIVKRDVVVGRDVFIKRDVVKGKPDTLEYSWKYPKIVTSLTNRSIFYKLIRSQLIAVVL